MFVRRRAAFTLIEAMVATVLLLAILVVAGQAITGAVKAQRRGDAHRQAMTFAREALSRMTTEMSTALSLGVLPNGSEMLSGVAYPDYSPDPGTVPFTGSFYLRERVNVPNSGGQVVRVDRAYNRLIFSAAGKRSAQFTDSLTDFVFVEYAVIPRADDPTLPQHRLFRRTFRVLADPTATTIPGLAVAANFPSVVGSFFALDPTNPYSNPNMLEASLTPDQRRERCLVLELPRSDDEISFSIEHNQALNPRQGAFGVTPAYETGLFTVKVLVNLDRERRESNGKYKFMASHELTQQVTIKTGY